MQPAFNLPFGLCLLSTFSTIFLSPTSAQELQNHGHGHVPRLQRQVAGTSKTGPNILFIMSDDQGKRMIRRCQICYAKQNKPRPTSEFDGGNAKCAKAFG